jgi:hypothetical protein
LKKEVEMFYLITICQLKDGVPWRHKTVWATADLQKAALSERSLEEQVFTDAFEHAQEEWEKVYNADRTKEPREYAVLFYYTR